MFIAAMQRYFVNKSLFNIADFCVGPAELDYRTTLFDNIIETYKIRNNEVFVVPHSSPEVPAQFPILCVYLMGSNWSSAYQYHSVMIAFMHSKAVVRIKVG